MEGITTKEIINTNGVIVNKFTFSNPIWGIKCNETRKGNKILFSEVVRILLANKRQGTHSTKDISGVNGTTKKPFAQKGGGRARQGSLRSTQFRGGGVTFGPTPRDYSSTLPMGKKREALRRAMRDLCLQGKMIIVDNVVMPDHKTKTLVEMIKKVAPEAKKVLIILNQEREAAQNIILASRNLQYCRVVDIAMLDLYTLFSGGQVVIEEGALHKLQEIMESNVEGMILEGCDED